MVEKKKSFLRPRCKIAVKKGLLLDSARQLRGTNWLLVTSALPYIDILTDVHKIQWISIFPFYLCMPLTLKIDFGARFIHTTFICIWILYADWVTFPSFECQGKKTLQNFKTSQIFQMSWDFESLGTSWSTQNANAFRSAVVWIQTVFDVGFTVSRGGFMQYIWEFRLKTKYLSHTPARCGKQSVKALQQVLTYLLV